MKDTIKAIATFLLIVIMATIAESITVSAHGIAWEEANGQPILTSVGEIYGFTDAEIDLLARMAYAEARGEGEQGM